MDNHPNGVYAGFVAKQQSAEQQNATDDQKEEKTEGKDDKKAECLECGKILFNKQSLEKILHARR